MSKALGGRDEQRDTRRGDLKHTETDNKATLSYRKERPTEEEKITRYGGSRRRTPLRKLPAAQSPEERTDREKALRRGHYRVAGRTACIKREKRISTTNPTSSRE